MYAFQAHFDFIVVRRGGVTSYGREHRFRKVENPLL